MGHHIDSEGRFQSDKHPALAPDKIVINFKHPQVWKGLVLIAEDYREIDPDLADDIMTRIRSIRAGR